MTSARYLIKIDVEWGIKRLVHAQQIVEQRPYDMESWSLMLREAQTRPVNEVRTLYESLVNVFPTTARYWTVYIEMEMRSGFYERVEKLFQRCLVKILNIDLWKLYLTYLRDTKAGLSMHKEKMSQVYDFALKRIGMDLHSLNIWQDYIHFLHGVEAIGNYAVNQKINDIRRVYQKVIVTPIVGIELLWKDYIAFEQNINPLDAEKVSLERSKDHMNARRVAKELTHLTKGLNCNLPAVPPTLAKAETKQIELWKRFIAYEKSNPLRTEDTALVTHRVMFAIEQCLLVLTHHPAVWHQASKFLETSAGALAEKGDLLAAKIFANECANILERSINGVLYRNALLHFVYADFEEGRLKYDKVHSIYNKLLAQPDIDPTLVYVQYMKFIRRTKGIKSARAIFKQARKDVRSSYHIFVTAALMEYYCSKDKEIAFRIFEMGLERYGDNPDYVLCYIDYLSHLNEDNNTRMLFERVLSSGCLTPPRSVEIWNRFLDFESNIGDLSSILKVQRRRNAVFGRLNEYKGKETALLVERYKFLDMYPCNGIVLKSIGYASPVDGDAKDKGDATQSLARPDFTQMIPFKPCTLAMSGDHPLVYGIFPQPPGLAALCAALPPPNCYRGPFVSVELLFDIFMRLNLPESAPQPNGDNDLTPKIFDFAQSVHWIVDTCTNTAVRERRLLPTGDDSDDELQPTAPPPNDVYRLRQLKRFATCK
ncbi:protein suppressor of forked-like [Drosophila grimshawi]|uniref:protein suppressor of forked-like n=1 Tax=Drosophila grimshawi TaxID=7222 RepID=UPI000C86F72E|nr:protein suppressor of forked-like [Drosophila grimshawi]